MVKAKKKKSHIILYTSSESSRDEETVQRILTLKALNNKLVTAKYL